MSLGRLPYFELQLILTLDVRSATSALVIVSLPCMPPGESHKLLVSPFANDCRRGEVTHYQCREAFSQKLKELRQ